MTRIQKTITSSRLLLAISKSAILKYWGLFYTFKQQKARVITIFTLKETIQTKNGNCRCHLVLNLWKTNRKAAKSYLSTNQKCNLCIQNDIHVLNFQCFLVNIALVANWFHFQSHCKWFEMSKATWKKIASEHMKS